MKRLIGLLFAGGAIGAGVFLMHRGTPRLSGSRGRNRRHSLRGESEANELKLYIDNDGDLYRQQTTSIMKNLVTKIARGIYDASKAEKLWMYLVENGAKKYVREFGTADQPWHKLFSQSDRKAVAKELNEHFLDEYKNGSYDQYIPKKYRKAARA